METSDAPQLHRIRRRLLRLDGRAEPASARRRILCDRMPPDIAEEIESIARSDRRELKRRLIVLVMHLLKWQHQPAGRSRSWSATIDEQRLQIDRRLAESPSLRPNAAAMLGEVHQSAGQERSPKPDWPMRPSPRRVPSRRTRCCRARFFPKAEGRFCRPSREIEAPKFGVAFHFECSL